MLLLGQKSRYNKSLLTNIGSKTARTYFCPANPRPRCRRFRAFCPACLGGGSAHLSPLTSPPLPANENSSFPATTEL